MQALDRTLLEQELHLARADGARFDTAEGELGLSEAREENIMRPITIAVLLLAVVGCGGPSNSTVEAQTAANATAETTAAIAAAQTAATKDDAQASLHLKLARDQLQEAKELMREDENDKAHLVLQRATADAELALMLARKTDAEEKAGRARQQVDSLSPEQ